MEPAGQDKGDDAIGDVEADVQGRSHDIEASRFDPDDVHDGKRGEAPARPHKHPASGAE
jgi:hypothetical protein